MKIEFELNKQDYINFNLNHLRHSDELKRTIAKQRYVIPVIYLTIPFILDRFAAIPLWYGLTIFSVLAVIWAAFYPQYYKWRVARLVSKMIDEGNNIGMLGKRCISLTEAGIVDTGESDESKTNWESVESIEETEEYIYVYNSAISAYLIPKRSFSSISEQESFLIKLQSYVDSAHAQR